MTDERWTVAAADGGMRLDKYLASADRLGSRSRAAAALERGKVFVNGAEAALADASRALAAGDDVRVWTDRPGSANPRRSAGRFGALRVVFEDESLIVVDKPAGLLSVPLERNPGVPSVFDLVEAHLRSHRVRPLVVHRIDQDTSGLVVFARTPDALRALRGQFRRREPERVYWAVVYGHPDPPAGTWRDHLVWDEKALIQKATHPRDPGANEAISHYRVLERLRDASLVEVRLDTGRRNQIRIQARLRGHMLVGETRYTYGPAALRPVPFGRHALHAWRLAFDHPADGRRLELTARPPADFADLLARLGSRATR